MCGCATGGGPTTLDKAKDLLSESVSIVEAIIIKIRQCLLQLFHTRCIQIHEYLQYTQNRYVFFAHVRSRTTYVLYVSNYHRYRRGVQSLCIWVWCMYVCMNVCPDGRVTQKNITPIDVIMFTQEVLCPWFGPPLG